MHAKFSFFLTLLLGIAHTPLWTVIPVALVNNAIGLNTPPGRLQETLASGISYLRLFSVNLPLMGALTFAIYGVGYGLALLFS